MEKIIRERLSDVIEKRFTSEKLLMCQPRITTGFQQLDSALGGGIAPGLIVLGAGPGLGKSTFALQIAEQAAQQTPVLYFSMEMSSERIAAKLVSSRLFQISGGSDCITSDQLVGGIGNLPVSAALLTRIEEACRYQKDRMRQCYIIEEPLSASGIAETVDQFMEENTEAGKPLVIVDYLQILPPDSAKAKNEKQAVEDSLKQMVRLAHRGVPVILISSLNRSSYRGSLQIDAFKETGGIEYSADVLLGLQFSACHKKEALDMETEKSRCPREMEIAILKQRYGSSGGFIKFQYYAAYDFFKSAEGTPMQISTEMDTSAVSIPVQASDSFADPSDVSISGQAADFAAAPLYESDFVFQESPVQPEEAAEPDPGAPPAGEEPKAAAPREREFIRKRSFVIANTKIANEIRRGRYGSALDCVVFSDVNVQYDLSQPLSCFDCHVADAIYTLFQWHRDSFSTGQVMRILSGDNTQTLTQQKKRGIIDSVERLRNTAIRISCTEEMRRRKKIGSEGEKIFQGQFLSLREENGRYFFPLEGDSPMPLYAYGEMSRQFISFPETLLNVSWNGKSLSNSAETISIKRFLIRRLEIIRNPRNKADSSSGMTSISFQDSNGLMEELRLRERYPSSSVRSQRRRKYLDTAIKILDYYQRIGYISGYHLSGQSIQIIGPIQNPWKLI